MKRLRPIVFAGLCCAAVLLPGSAARGAAWLPPSDLASGNVGAADVTMTPQGEVIAVWRIFDGGQYDLLASVRPPGGEFGPATSISPLKSVVENIDIASDPAGNAIVTWRQSLGGVEKVGLIYSYRPAGGEFSQGVNVAAAGEHVALPVTAMDAAGNAITVFRRAPGSDNHIAYLYRPAGGDYGAQQEITSYGGDSPRVEMADDGTAIAAWTAGTKVEAAQRPAGGSFGSIQTLVASNGAIARLAVGPSGRALLAWRKYDGAHYLVEAAVAEPGGTFGTPVPLSNPGVDSERFAVAVADGGLALIAWRDGDDEGPVKVMTSTPGAGFEPASAPPGNGLSPGRAEFAEDGSMILEMGQSGPAPFELLAARRTPSGEFEAATQLTLPDESAFNQALSGDGKGNFIDLFQREEESGYTLRARGYDGVAPSFSALSVPERTRTGVKTAFSASVFDVWGPTTTAWTFGDGGSADGSSVTHVYKRTGGKRTVEATATDAAGNTSSEQRTVAVKDATRVVILSARFRPAKFAVGRKATAVAAKLRRGSVLRYRLSEKAKVSVTFERAVRGRRRGKRFVRVGKIKPLRRAGRRGANRIRFSGRIGRRALRPGRYRAVLRATDTGGLKSKPRRARFKIAGGARRLR